MRQLIPALVLLPALFACPGELGDQCVENGCGDDEYCVVDTGMCATDIVFLDAKLEACVRDELGRAEGPITVADGRGLTSLECPDRDILLIHGVEQLRDLEVLALWENNIDDLRPLAGATRLRELQLGFNHVHDLSPLTGLQELRRLGLSFNDLTDIGPLAELRGLVWLNLDHNAIQDMEPLRQLDSLIWLTAEDNPVGDWNVSGELDDQGCEVYKRRDAGPAPLASPPQRPAGQRAVRGQASPLLLGSRETADGELLLTVRADGRLHDVLKEYPGQLRRRGAQIVYQLRGQAFAVGELDSLGPQLCRGLYAASCQLAIGRKGPDGRLDGTPGPVYSANLRLRGLDGQPGGRLSFKSNGDRSNVLEPYVLASPNQYDGGTCLFMANTGAMEILLNQHLPQDGFGYLGETDLSERYLISASEYLSQSEMPYSITDVVYTYNKFGGSLLSRDYPFAMGYMKDTASGGQVPCDENDPDAYLSCQINWYDAMPGGWQTMLVSTPTADRTVLFVDPNLSQNSIWNVGLINDDVIERIKYELRTKHAPVIVVYNHFLYWHSVIVIGYDNNEASGDCPMVRQSISYFDEQGQSGYANKIRQHMEREGGCTDHGVFYVRDSIYDGDDEPMYDYGDYSDRYSEKVVVHSTDWAKYLGNHVYTVHRR